MKVLKDERRLFVVYSVPRWQPSRFSRRLSALLFPGREKCTLARLTCGRMGVKGEWRDFLRSLDFPSAAMGSAEFSAAFPKVSFSPPCILFCSGGDIRVAAGAGEIKDCSSVQELAALARLGLRLAA